MQNQPATMKIKDFFENFYAFRALQKGFILLAIYFFAGSYSNANCQDTIPPVWIQVPGDTSFSCSTPQDINLLLGTFYQYYGDGIAADNSGSFTIESSLSLSQALSIFNASGDTLCGNTRSVTIIFFAVDSSDNRSEGAAATFSTFDNTSPVWNASGVTSISCHTGLRDTLISWINSGAGYTISDNCSDSIYLRSFQYKIIDENMEIEEGGGIIGEGPYPAIPDSLCEWTINVSVSFEDECGNSATTDFSNAISITDDVPPQFFSPPQDAVVLCHKVTQPVTPDIADGCSRALDVVFEEISSQSSDSSSCGFYTYNIKRSWTVRDYCGNQSIHVQNIEVIDTIPPKVVYDSIYYVTCSSFEYFKDSMLLDSVIEFCGDFDITWEQNPAQDTCVFDLYRVYNLSDICGNNTKINQTIKVINDTIQVFATPADRYIYCDSFAAGDAAFAEWLEAAGGGSMMSTCSSMKFFAAVPGSYKPGDTMSYPGIHPALLDKTACQGQFDGYIKRELVDFVFYDSCGQYKVFKATFGVKDTLAPIIQSCPESVSVEANASGCVADIKLPAAIFEDNCISPPSPIILLKSERVVSDNPGSNEALVNPVTITLGPVNTNLFVIGSDVSLNVLFKNLDIDDINEYFNIYDEKDKWIGRSQNTASQCGSTDMTFTLPAADAAELLSDGYLTLKFLPQAVSGDPVTGVNDICSGSMIEASLNFEIESVNELHKTYSLNDSNPMNYAADSISLILPVGVHHIKFAGTDCANNQNECDLTITVDDNISPVMICPQNISFVLDKGTCSDSLMLSLENLAITDACTGNKRYEQFVPENENASFLSFFRDSVNNTFLARNKQFLFRDVLPVLFLNQDPVLEIEFFGDQNQLNEYFTILGPDGTVLGFTSGMTDVAPCLKTFTSLTIPKSKFNSWINNQEIVITAVPNNTPQADGFGINPCGNVNPINMRDGLSYMKIRLKYTDALLSYSLTGPDNIPATDLPEGERSISTILKRGITTITLFTEDGNANPAECRFEVDVRDQELPVARCKNNVVTIHPSGLEPFNVVPQLIDNGSSDNCSGDLRLECQPAALDCSMVNSDISVKLIAIDGQGNRDTCESMVKVKPFELIPTFSSGLCQGDTLKLFSNIPPSSIPNTYTFHWKGPGNLEFFQENPVLPNINESFNGLYLLKVTGFNQCITEGSVLVNVKPLIDPEISASAQIVCEDEEVSLTTTNFTGDIEYIWYEGVAPNGIPLAVTKIPQFLLRPAVGVHFYYVVAKGPDCSSNPSKLLKITVRENPVAIVNQIFLNVCEGGDIILGTTVAGSGYTYNWIGPSGFQSDRQNPDIIRNATISNQGFYRLQIANGDCLSDTVSTQVVVLDRPEKPVINSSLLFCEGSTVSIVIINVNTADLYQWYQDGILRFTTNQNNLTIPNVQSSFQGNWYVVAQKGSCFSERSDIRAISIENQIQIGASNTGPACMGDSVQLLSTFVPNATYKWTGPDPNLIIPAVHNPRVFAIPGYYSLTITTPTSCQNTAGTTVEVIPVPSITAISTNAQPCMDGIKSFSFSVSVFPPSSNYQYVWSGPSGFTSNMATPTIQNALPRDTGNYRLTVFNRGCASVAKDIFVSYNMIPEKPSISGPAYACEGDTVVLNIPGGQQISGANFNWITPSGPRTTSESGLLIQGATVSATGNYQVRVERSGCTSENSDPYFLEIRKKPNIPEIKQLAPVCFESNFKLESNYTELADFFWSGPQGFVSSVVFPVISGATQNNEGFYSLRIRRNGCFSDPSESVFIDILPKIDAPRTTVSNYDFCALSENPVQICVDPSTMLAGDTIIYVLSSTMAEIFRSSSPCIMVSGELGGLSAGQNLVSAFIKRGNCLSPLSAGFVININTPPDIKASALQGDDLSLCQGEFLQLQATHSPPVVEVEWFSPDQHIFFSGITGNAAIVSGFKPGKNRIILSYNYRSCEAFTMDTISVFVEGVPVAADDYYTIEFNNNAILNITDNDELPQQYEFEILTNPDYGTIDNSGNGFIYQPDITNLRDVSFTYRVCSSSCPDFCDIATVFVYINQDIECLPPTIITPNQDGINDTFFIPCLSTGNYPRSKIFIFNEWGNEVFSVTPYKNDWQGEYNGGPLPAGTYFYVLDLDNDSEPIKGFLIIQR